MAHKYFIFFVLLFSLCFVNNNVCYCADNLPTINLEQSEAIFDFALNTSKISNKTYYNNTTPTAFMNYFNNYVAQSVYDLSNGECDNSYHYIVLCEDKYIYFLVTNAELSNTLEFLKIDVRPSEVHAYNIRYQYLARIELISNNNFNYSTFSNNLTTAILFYNGDNSIWNATFDDTGETLTTPNLFYLGPKPLSSVSVMPDGSSTYRWAFLEHCFGFRDDDPNNPNIPSGDIPSGDIPSGDTPNYNDKLDNISGLIGDTNTKLDGISGEIAQTNNKLDGISGELGEINDNLTIVPDLSGTTINSGDIESALNFDFAEDPYSNFWLELTTGLSSSLTGNKRSIIVDFRNKSYTISLDEFALQVPEFLKSFLAIISTTLVVWQIVRYIKIIIDKISSGNMDTVLAMNEEERNC